MSPRNLLPFLLTLVISVAATAQAPALRIVVIEGEDAVNVVPQRTAVAPIIEVRDRNDQPVAGAIVRFAISRGRATFNGARVLTVTTDAAGRAAATGLTPTGTGAIQIGTTATFQGQTAAVTIAQTNVMTTAGAGAGSSAGGAGGGSGGGIGTGTIVGIGAGAAGGLVTLRALNVLGGRGDCVAGGPNQTSSLPGIVPAAGGTFFLDYEVTCTRQDNVEWTVSSDQRG